MSGILLGTRGTGDWETDERPKNWRETILYLYPNGDMPLTGLLAKLKSEKTSDPEFNWWTKSLPDQAVTLDLDGTSAGIFLNTDLGSTHQYSDTYTAGVAGAVISTTVYVKMPLANANEFRPGHLVVFRSSTYTFLDCVGKVTAVTKNGASSYLTVSLLEADDNGGTTVNIGIDSAGLVGADRLLIIGNVNEEGAPMPSPVSYYPTKYNNYTQIFRTPLSITRTARLTKLRTGDAYQRMKKEALEMHGVEMEKGFFFGIPTENTGTGGKPERTTGGLLYNIRTNAAANVDDYRRNATYTGKEWLDAGGGEAWLDAYLEQVFRYGSGTKLAFCGSGALLGLNKLAKAAGHMNISVGQASWGIKIVEWITPFGTIYLKLHPLFSHESSLRNSVVILEPENLNYRYVTDTTFYGSSSGGNGASGAYGTYNSSTNTGRSGRLDGVDEEYLTECGLEFHHPSTMMFLSGVGSDNAL
jgi:hypothetical protein